MFYHQKVIKNKDCNKLVKSTLSRKIISRLVKGKQVQPCGDVTVKHVTALPTLHPMIIFLRSSIQQLDLCCHFFSSKVTALCGRTFISIHAALQKRQTLTGELVRCGRVVASDGRGERGQSPAPGCGVQLLVLEGQMDAVSEPPRRKSKD